jgi:ribosomal protein L16 Arg81 hydroxylase
MNFLKIDHLIEAVALNDRPIFIKGFIPNHDVLYDIANGHLLREQFVNNPESIDTGSHTGQEAIDLFESKQKAISIVNWGLPGNERVTEIVREFSRVFGDAIVGSHLYSSLEGGESFGYHFDSPMNIILQVEGQSRVCVSDMRAMHCTSPEILSMLGDQRNILNSKLEETTCLDLILEPGDAIYIPYKQFHKIEGLTDRISLSFPISCTEIVQGHRLQ